MTNASNQTILTRVTVSQPHPIQQGFVSERVVRIIRDFQNLGMNGSLTIELRDGVPQKAKFQCDAENLLTKLK